jgi:hypothetical protein
MLLLDPVHLRVHLRITKIAMTLVGTQGHTPDVVPQTFGALVHGVLGVFHSSS